MKTKSKERILFNQFLKENGCLKRFVKNYKDVTLRLSLSEYFEVKDPFRYISSAFKWDYTLEGDGHWRYLNERWHNTLNEQ